MKSESPLVSIVVISYNSARYILETLESAKKQTYQNIELIVSDDGSSDDTVKICEEWLKKNSERFVRTELITVDSNTGIPANCNRGGKIAKGEWIKFFAGDDVLLDNCIEKNIKFVLERSGINLVVSQMKMIGENNKIFKPNEVFFGSDITSDKQHYLLIHKGFFSCTPTLFIKRLVYNDVPFDEDIKLMEDHPFAINATKKGYVFSYMPEATVYYRLHAASVSSREKQIFSSFYRTEYEFYLKYIAKEQSLFKRLDKVYTYYLYAIFDRLQLNKDKLIYKAFFLALYSINPFRYISRKQKTSMS